MRTAVMAITPAFQLDHTDDYSRGAHMGMTQRPAADAVAQQRWLEIIWPETGLHTVATGPERDRNTLSEEDELALTIDFVTLSLTPLEFIQLASFMRMCVDGLLDRHPNFQRAVVNAFDIKE